MSLRLGMLQVARLAPRALEGSAELVAGFIARQQHPQGGFRDRRGGCDLYYTVFGLACLQALGEEVPREPVERYLGRFGSGEGLDLVHLASLARAWASLGRDRLPAELRSGLLGHLESFRHEDGGYGPGTRSTVYGCFLALGAYQDLRVEPPGAARLARWVVTARAPGGGYANEPGAPAGATPATAAAVTLLRELGEAPDPGAGEWLRERFLDGGFTAVPGAPVPDLLSTAVALHALAALESDVAPIREECLDFMDTLWTNEGTFHSSWLDADVDCEYTFYGLLALGHLSL